MTDRHTRRTFLIRGATLAAGAAGLSLAGPGFGVRSLGPGVASAHNVASDADRAVELYDAMQQHFYLGPSQGHLYNETSPRGRSNPYAYLWPFYEAMAATIDLAGISPQFASTYGPAVQERRTGLKNYLNTADGKVRYAAYPVAPYGGGGDAYRDDNAWVCRALIQWHQMTGDASALDGAKQLYPFLESGWAATATPHPGGVYWVDAGWNRDRGAAVTAGYAKTALQLHRSVPTAEKAITWVTTALFRGDDLYADKIRGVDGQVDWGVWSYNQGVLIGACVLLYRQTRKQDYLDLADRTARATIRYFDMSSHDWYTQPVIFNVLFFRNLLLLYGQDPQKYAYGYTETKKFADRVWDDASIHNKQKHLIKFDPSTSAYKLREQAAMVQIYACLAWDPERKNPGVYAKLA